MIECLNSSTGTSRHDEYREAMFRVQTSESFAESTWCAPCLIEYVEVHNMGSCVSYVELLAEPETKAARDQLDKVLGLGLAVERP
jgi:hypothetical protein